MCWKPYAGLKGDGTSTLDLSLDSSGQFYNLTFGADLNDPSNLQLIDAGNWGQDGYYKAFQVKDDIKAFRLDATRTFDEGFLSSIEFGYNFTDHTKQKSADEFKLCITDCTYPGGVKNTAPFPGTTGSFSFGGIDGLAIFDAATLLNSGFYNLVRKDDQDITRKNWEVNEQVQTFFVQANIDTDIGDNMSLRGNVGFQYVSVDQSSTAITIINGAPTGELATNGDSYGDFLPSLNLSLGLPADQYLRFAAARQTARPRMDDLRSSLDIGICLTSCNTLTGPVWSGGGGNPKLKPWLANAFDLSYEKYFTTDAGNKGYVSAAYFYKDLLSYIYGQPILWDYSGYPLPPPSPGQTVGVNYPSSTNGILFAPANGEGGTPKVSSWPCQFRSMFCGRRWKALASKPVIPTPRVQSGRTVLTAPNPCLAFRSTCPT